MITCPHCSELTEEGSFCEYCGGSLDDLPQTEEADSTSIEEQVSVEKSEETHTNQEEEKSFISHFKDLEEDVDEDEITYEEEDDTSVNDLATQPGVKVKQSERVAEQNRVQNEGTYDEDDLSECKHFELLFNVSRVFVVDFYSAFDFRIKGIHPILSQKAKYVRLRIESNYLPQTLEDRLFLAPRFGKTKDFNNLNFRPSEPGYDVSFTVVLEYELEGRQYCYYSSIKTDVFMLDEEGSKIIESVNVRFGDVKADHAADLNLRLLDNLKQNKGTSKAEQIRQLKLEPVWKTLELEGDNSEQEDIHAHSFARSQVQPPLNALKHLAMLNVGRERIFLWSKKSLSLGRDRNRCNVIVRTFEQGGMVNRAKTMAVSGMHLELWFEDNSFWVKDHSTNGTVVGDKRLVKNTPERLTTGKTHWVLMGGQSVDSVGTTYKLEVIGSGMNVGNHVGQSACAVIIHRVDAIEETHVLLKKGITLSTLFDADFETTLEVTDNSFYLLNRAGIEWLCPGSTHQTGSKLLTISPPWQFTEQGPHEMKV